jgi:hypothetical protein
MGNCVNAQIKPMASSAQRVWTRLTKNPVAMEEMEKRKKKLEPINRIGPG